MGLLQVLIETHPATGLHICIDNQGVVKRWEKDMRADPRARSKGSARAAWDRIEHIRQEREKAGGITKVSWIHSHVERDKKEGQNNREETETKGDEKKRKIKGRPSLFPYSREEKQEEGESEKRESEGRESKAGPTVIRCVCGEGTCRKEHVHHRGNDAADLEADTGRLSEATEDDCQMRGEERYHMTYKGGVCQGDITTVLKLATHENRLSRMENSAKRTERDARAAIQMSNDSMRKAVWKGNSIATRYITRAIGDRLPTYKNENELIQPGNAYEYMYGEALDGGTCKLCKEGSKETLGHILGECEAGKEIREKAVREVGNLWDSSETEGGWPMHDYIGTHVRNWKQKWSWLGLTPKSIANTNTTAKDSAILKKAAKLLAQAGHDMWVNRVKKVREWEEEVGIAPRKAEVTGHKWNKPEGPKRKRGRPRKLEEELDPKYLKIRRRSDKTKELVGGGMREVEAKAQALREGKEEEKKDAHKAAAKGMQPLPTARVDKQERQSQFKVTVAYKAKATRVKKVKGQAGAKDKKRYGDREPNEDDLEAYRVVNGGCDVRGCDKEGVILPSFCKAHSMRCKVHESLFCLGFTTLCACRREETGTNAEPVKITKRGWEKLKRLEEGDRIQVRRVKGKKATTKGVVTGFEWEGTGGFRIPDHILLEMDGGEDGTEEAAVRVDGDWERMEQGEEGEKDHGMNRDTEKGEAEAQSRKMRAITRKRKTQTGVSEHEISEIDAMQVDVQGRTNKCREIEKQKNKK